MKNALLDIAQGASNAAASTVSAPVDGIAWLLRKAGINVPTPVGGSDWMAAQGLTKQPRNALMGAVGESLGVVAPMLAVAKAPQVANALIQAEDAAGRWAFSVGQRGADMTEAYMRRSGIMPSIIDTDALKKRFPDVDFSVRQSDDKAFLDRIIVPKEQRNAGVGSEFMKALVDAADADKARLGLTPSSDFGGAKSRLEAFYRRFGFVPNKGKNRDFELMAAMIRQPR